MMAESPELVAKPRNVLLLPEKSHLRIRSADSKRRTNLVQHNKQYDKQHTEKFEPLCTIDNAIRKCSLFQYPNFMISLTQPAWGTSAGNIYCV